MTDFEVAMAATDVEVEKDFFEAVGRTLVKWQRVEGRLVGIYLLLLGSPGAWPRHCDKIGAIIFRTFH
jgi:hypothetical protein